MSIETLVNWVSSWVQWLKGSPLKADSPYIQVKRPSKGKRRKQVISKVLRDQVWTTYVGETFKTQCLCCQHNCIDALHFECGHVQAEALGGLTHLANLRPICRTCNSSMGKQHMVDFMKRCGFDTRRIQAK